MTVRVKICGITNVADAESAVQFGADMIGLNFYEQSPRHVDAFTAAAIRFALPPAVEPVGVFVNETLAAAKAFADMIDVPTVQLHGTPQEPASGGPVRWIAAFAVEDAASLQAIMACLSRLKAARAPSPAAVLVDARVPGMHGGTGKTLPWHLLERFDPGVPLILAGGLTPDNVAEAIRIVRPFAVDVASGVESRPGMKDPEKMRRFIDAVRAVG